MIRNINLSNYKNPVVEKDDEGKEVFYDKVKGSYRPAKPEEFVRQKFIRFLHKKLEIPYEAMRTEESMAHKIPKNKDRMDISVERDTNKGHKIVMVVECKAPEVALTDEVYEQAKKYAEPLKIPVIIVTNGREFDCIKRNSDNTYEDIPKIPSYEELADYKNIKTMPIEKYSYERWTYDELHREDVLNAERKIMNHIVPETKKDTAIHSLNISECFLDITHKVKNLPLKNYIFEEDEGVYTKIVGHPADDFVVNTRLLKIKDKNGNNRHVGFFVTLNANKPENSSTYVHPSLYVSTYFKNTFHNALQLNLDNNMKIEGNHLRFTHNYDMKLKGQKLKDYVKSKNLFEVNEKEHIILGDINVSGLLYCDTPEMNVFMANLIEYAILRDEYKTIYENNKEKRDD